MYEAVTSILRRVILYYRPTKVNKRFSRRSAQEEGNIAINTYVMALHKLLCMREIVCVYLSVTIDF